MSNHFTGLSLGPPLGDPRLDLCDLYAFQSPAGSTERVRQASIQSVRYGRRNKLRLPKKDKQD
jgi:hypothetical protein